MNCFVFSKILLGYFKFLFHLEFPYFFNTFNVHFGQIQYFFKVLKTDFEILYFFNTFNTAWEPW